MKKHTYREYLTWMKWFELQMDVPSRSDNYLMQIAAEVKRVLSKDPSKILTKDFRLTFSRKTAGDKRVPTEEEISAATNRSRSFWGGLKSLITKKKPDGK